MMKILRTVLMVMLIVLPSVAQAGMFDKIKKVDAPKKSAKKVNIDGLVAREVAVKLKVRTATVAFATALIDMHIAVGNKDSAERLKATVNSLQAKKNDKDALKACVEEVNKASDELNKMDLSAKMDGKIAKEKMGSAILRLGAGVILDGFAVSDAKNLMTEASDGLKTVQASPMSHGPSAAVNLKSVVSTASFVSSSVPPQIMNVKDVSSKLVEYSKKNQIGMPSAAEIEKAAKDMEKG